MSTPYGQPFLVEIVMKDGEVCHELQANRQEVELLVGELELDPEVHAWSVYEQIKSSYPAPRASDDQR